MFDGWCVVMSAAREQFYKFPTQNVARQKKCQRLKFKMQNEICDWLFERQREIFLLHSSYDDEDDIFMLENISTFYWSC